MDCGQGIRKVLLGRINGTEKAGIKRHIAEDEREPQEKRQRLSV
jgi:hypothetical protein